MIALPLLVLHLIGLSLTGGLLLGTLFAPLNRVQLFMGLMGGSLWLWLVALLVWWQMAETDDAARGFLSEWQVILMALHRFTLVLFVVMWRRLVGWRRWLLIGAAVWLMLAVLIGRLTGTFFVSDTALDLTTHGQMVLALGGLLIGLTFLVSYQAEASPPLLALLALSVGHGLTLAQIDPQWALQGLLSASTTALLAGPWLRHQLQHPLQEMNRYLAATNAHLQQNVEALRREKDEVQRLNVRIAEANRYKTEFMSMMSHEFRTPLNSIVGYSELLMSGLYGELNDQQSNRLLRIHHNSLHLATMIEHVLDLSKMEAEPESLQRQEVSLVLLLEGLVSAFRPRCADKGLDLRLEAHPRAPTITGDERRLQQVFYHLLDNAVKFTHRGYVLVSIQPVRVHDGHSTGLRLPGQGWLSDGHWLVVKVVDSGIGIAPESQGRIFERFAQADSSYAREYGGIGLGLALTKRIVELHDGLIWVRSQAGKGSSFFVALPLV